MVRGVSVCVLALLGISVSGCLGGAEDALAPSPTGTGETVGNETVDDSAVLRFSGSPAGTMGAWFNGSVPPTHECPIECEMTYVDVSELVPADVPSRIAIRFRVDTTTAFGGSPLQVYLTVGEGAVLYESAAAYPDSQTQHLDYVVIRRSGTVEVVIYNLGFPMASSTDYELEVVVTWDPSVVPSPVPVAFQARVDGAMTVTADASGRVEAVVYAPDGHVTTRWDEDGPIEFIPPTSGRFVLLPLEGSENLTLSVNSTEPGGLEPLRVERVSSALTPFAGAVAAPYEWTFDVSEVPVRVGVVGLSPKAVETSAMAGHLRIESPAGVVVDAPAGCQSTCIRLGIGSFAGQSELGHPDLVSGQYSATYTPAAADAGIIVHYWDRLVPV